MMNLLAQATQPIVMNGGYREWSTGEWIAVVSAIVTLICVTALPSIASFILSLRSNTAAAQAQTTATAANAKADMNSDRITNVSNHATAIDGKVTDIALQVQTGTGPGALGNGNGAGPVKPQ